MRKGVQIETKNKKKPEKNETLMKKKGKFAVPC